MRIIPIALANHLAGRATTIATCWKVTRTDDQVFGFTSHDRDVVVDGVTYVAATAISRSAIGSNANLDVANVEAKGFLSGDAITEEDVRAGMWDHAEVRIFDVNWADPTMGELKHLRGWLGEFSTVRGQYTAELRGLAAAFNSSIGEVVGPGCSATVGDARCKVDMTDYTTTGEVVGVTDARVFDTDLSAATVRLTPTTTGTPPTGYFIAGLLLWLTGANAGRRVEVKTYADTGDIVLQLPMTDPIAPGDTFSVSAGCGKARDGDCLTKYGNVVNFRGFPDLPGLDKVLRVGGQ